MGTDAMTRILVVVSGAALGAAVWMLAVMWVSPSKEEAEEELIGEATLLSTEVAGQALRPTRVKPTTTLVSIWQIIIGGCAFFFFWTISGYVGLGVAAAEVAIILPLFWKATKSYTIVVERDESLMAWVGNVRDMVSGGSNLKRSITLCAQMAQPPIDAAVLGLTSTLNAGGTLRDAMFVFGDDVASPTSDRLVAMVITASEQGAGGIVDMLNQLIEDTRRSITATREIIRERKKILTTSKWLSVLFTIMIGGAAAFMGQIMQGYKGFLGQTVLIIVMLLWGACVLWLYRVNRPPKEYRITLTTPEEQTRMVAALAEVVA